MEIKRCKKCGEEKPLTEFYKGRLNRGGYIPRCKSCIKAVMAAFYLKNKDRILSRSMAWAKTNHVHVAALAMVRNRRRGVKPKRVFASEEDRMAARGDYKRVYVERYPDRVNAAKASYAARFPERIKAFLATATARRRAAPGVVTGAEWKSLLIFYEHRCGQCGASGEKLTVDHFIPIIKGGHHSWDNVWPLCLKCNLRKGTRMPLEAHPPHVTERQEAACQAQA